MRREKRLQKKSNDEKAADRAEVVLRGGHVLTVDARRGYYTAGPYFPAVGPSGHAVYGYGDREVLSAREYVGEDSAREAARALVRSCGSTRVREAAIKATRRHESRR